MSELDNLLANPVEWKGYKLSPLSIAQVMRLQNESCDYPLTRAKAQINKLKDVLSPDDKFILINKAEEKCKQLRNVDSLSGDEKIEAK